MKSNVGIHTILCDGVGLVQGLAILGHKRRNFAERKLGEELGSLVGDAKLESRLLFHWHDTMGTTRKEICGPTCEMSSTFEPEYWAAIRTRAARGLCGKEYSFDMAG